MSLLDTPLTRHAGIEVPLICGAMYPCSNPELVAAVSEAGGIGIVQPLSLTYVHGHEFREGLRLIRRLTAKPIGMNALIEREAGEELARFFVTYSASLISRDPERALENTSSLMLMGYLIRAAEDRTERRVTLRA